MNHEVKPSPGDIEKCRDLILEFVQIRLPNFEWSRSNFELLQINSKLMKPGYDRISLQLTTEKEPIVQLLDGLSLGKYPELTGEMETISDYREDLVLVVKVTIRSGYLYYQTYLKSEKWRNMRGKILRVRGFKCELCGSKRNLQLHHLTYENLGNEQDGDVIILCKQCHSRAHDK